MNKDRDLTDIANLLDRLKFNVEKFRSKSTPPSIEDVHNLILLPLNEAAAIADRIHWELSQDWRAQ